MNIEKEQLRKLVEILERYKAGKNRTERRIVASENWWKLRNSDEESGDSAILAEKGQFKSRSGWLHNVLTSKHADMMDAYPEPNIRAREPDDQQEAKMLTSIIPCILEQNGFESVYRDVAWQKLKTGTGAYKIVWDSGKLNGLGDISISKVNLLNLYWEPGVTDIQKSRYFFHTELYDNDILEEQYPALEGKLGRQEFISTKFLYDDTISTDGKSTVIECYYHKRGILQYVKFVGDNVLYATEDSPLAESGLYDHGKFPYVFDTLFPIEGSPCGYGFVDICRSPQTSIDLLNTAFVRNSMVGSVPRFFNRADGGINEAEFLDLTKPVVHVSGGTLDESSIRQIPFSPLNGVYVSYLDRVIQELRETSGNTETSTGNVAGGVTAASAIAALQEASGKGSRDSNKASYNSFMLLVDMVIELIRQFYDVPRKFRIVGRLGMDEYVSYSNAGIRPQDQGNPYGVDLGYRKPVFDIKVSAQKKDVYTKVSQNELALQFFQLGFFNPQNADQALTVLDMMDFDGKEAVMQKISQNGTMFQKLQQYMQLALQLAMRAAPDMVQGLSQDIMQTMGAIQQQGGGGAVQTPAAMNPESSVTQNARARSAESTAPGSGAVTGRAKG